MGTPPVGSIVLVSFPYSDFSRLKKRPAVVIGKAEFENLILCQITSRRLTSEKAIELANSDFATGSLHINSFARPDKLFIIEKSVIQEVLGRLSDIKLAEIKSSVRELFR